MRKLIKKIFNNLGVKAKIILVVVMVTVLVTIAIANIRINQLSNQIDHQLLERLKDTTYTTVAIFDTVRFHTIGLLYTVANTPLVVRSFSEYADVDEELGKYLHVLFESMSQTENGESTFANIVLYDRYFAPKISALPDGEVPTMAEFPTNFLTARMGQTMISSAVRSHRTGLVQFLFTTPVMLDGQFEGVVAILANTQMLEIFLRDGVHRYGGYVTVADRYGNIFFSTRPEYIGRHMDELGVVEAFGHMPLETLFQHRSAITGIDKIAYISIDIALGWTVVSFFDAHTVDNVAMLIFASLIPTVSGVFVAAAFIILIIRYSLKPLEALAIGAKRVAQGNLDVTFEIQRNDELAQVSRSFNEILTALDILQENFKNAKSAMIRGDTEYELKDSRLGGIYDEMFANTNSIVKHMQESQLRAENASKAKSAFLSKMSHEIRTPLNAIIGMAGLVLREDLSGTAREQVTTIKQSGDHLLAIINDILDLSKVESGKLELVEADYLFHSTIQDVISILKMRMGNPDVRFAAYMQADIPDTLYGDEVRMRQILLNLLVNALKYTSKGQVTFDVTGEKKNEEIYILTMKIKDTGIGIKPEHIEKLFDEFSQFNLAQSRNVEGTGLGLAITNGLVKLMDGNIEVSSVYGEGSEFVITLPQKYKESKTDTPCFDDKNILLYCRTPLNAEYIVRALDDLAVTHELVIDDKELNDKLKEEIWDFVFADTDKVHVVQNIVKTLELTTKVVVLSDSYDASYETREGQDFALLVMPAYFISIVNVLSGRDGEHSANERTVEQFVAPGARILLVDDIETNLKVGMGLLKLYSVDVDTCLSGKSAIDAVLANDYDLVLMDHMMPEMDGVEAVKIIRSYAKSKDEKYARLPIIALTANAIVGAKEMFLENGFDDFLSKPVEFSKLNNILSKWIPKEKQIKSEVVPKLEVEKATFTIEDVDVAKAVVHSGGKVRDYLDILSIFYKNGITKITEIEDSLKQNDLPLYTIYVHALKSACANIGALKLSGEAKRLEAAGMSKDALFIKKHNDEFIDNLKTLLKNVDTVIKDNMKKPDDDKLLDSQLLKEHLTKLEAALKAFDVAEIDEISDQLQVFTQHPDIGEAINEILQSIFIGKYKQALKQIEELT